MNNKLLIIENKTALPYDKVLIYMRHLLKDDIKEGSHTFHTYLDFQIKIDIHLVHNSIVCRLTKV